MWLSQRVFFYTSFVGDAFGFLGVRTTLRVHHRSLRRLLLERVHRALAARAVRAAPALALPTVRESTFVVRERADRELARTARPLSLLRRANLGDVPDQRARRAPRLDARRTVLRPYVHGVPRRGVRHGVARGRDDRREALSHSRRVHALWPGLRPRHGGDRVLPRRNSGVRYAV